MKLAKQGRLDVDQARPEMGGGQRGDMEGEGVCNKNLVSSLEESLVPGRANM